MKGNLENGLDVLQAQRPTLALIKLASICIWLRVSAPFGQEMVRGRLGLSCSDRFVCKATWPCKIRSFASQFALEQSFAFVGSK